jgi:hypothetical protein
LNSSDPAVAASVQCLDELWDTGIIAQCLAQLANADHRCHVSHINTRPERIEQHRFAHHLPRMLDEIAQHGKGLTTQGDGFVPTPKLLVGEI